MRSGRGARAGPEGGDLGVAQLALPTAGRRFHREQAEDLQHVVLHHVLERAGAVVVAGAALEGEVLLPAHLDLLDVVGVPDGGEEGVVAAQGEEVLHRRHAERVVDAEDRLLPRVSGRAGQDLVQRHRVVEALAERLLERDPAARGRPLAERGDRGAEQPGRQREVGGDGAVAGQTR